MGSSWRCRWANQRGKGIWNHEDNNTANPANDLSWPARLMPDLFYQKQQLGELAARLEVA